MTDTNIIHALQCCGVETNCRNCPLYKERSAKCICTVLKNALDLIIRQQTELENLKIENQSLRSAANSLKMHYEEAQAQIERLKKTEIEIDDFCRRLCRMRMLNGNAIASYEDLQNYIQQEKSEAVKECLAKVKNYIKTHCNPYGKPDFDYDTSIKILNFIDTLVKETGGENNGST